MCNWKPWQIALWILFELAGMVLMATLGCMFIREVMR